MSQVFVLMCLERLCCGKVIRTYWFTLDDVRWRGRWRLVSHGNGSSLTDRWLWVLWLAVLRDSWGGTCSFSNQQASAHRRPQPERRCVVYQDCVQLSRDQSKILQVTGSLLILIIVCCCIVLCLRSDCEYLHAPTRQKHTTNTLNSWYYINPRNTLVSRNTITKWLYHI